MFFCPGSSMTFLFGAERLSLYNLDTKSDFWDLKPSRHLIRVTTGSDWHNDQLIGWSHDTMINPKTEDMTKLMMVDPMTDGHLIEFPMKTKTFKLWPKDEIQIMMSGQFYTLAMFILCIIVTIWNIPLQPHFC